MIRKIHRLLKCTVWFIRNIKTINFMLKTDDGERNFCWFVQNMGVVDRVIKSLEGKVE
jgi:hypothetical protein